MSIPRAPLLALAIFLFGAPAAADEPVAVAPTVAMGKPRMAKGGPLPKGTEYALGQMQPLLEACYRDAIDARHEGAASIELRLEIVAPGKVATAAINSSVDASAKLRSCVRDSFAGVAGGGVGPAPAEVLMSIGFNRDVPDDLSLSDSSCSNECDGDITDELRNEIRGRAMRAAHCFKRPASPGENATLKAGSLQVSVRIAPDGSVCGVATGADAFNRPSLTSCVIETMSDSFYNAPSGCVDVSLPLVFKGN
jgi:hypothetical protein